MHRGASWWRSNVFPCHATPCRLTHRLIEKPSLPCRFSTSLFSEENVSTKRSLTIFVTGNFFAGNLVSLIRSKDTYIPNLCSANLKETRLEESVYIATRYIRNTIEKRLVVVYSSRISIERYSKRFQTTAHFASPVHSTYSTSLPALPNSKTVAPLRVEIQGAGIQDAKLALQRPPRGSGRVRDSSGAPPRRLAPPRYTRSLECNYAFGFDVVARVMTAPRRLIGETSLRARTHTQRMDALSERGWFEAGWWRESKAGRQEVAV